MDYNFRKVYALKQQTPMIHFQSEQNGAILRATEVKPKLDRFILERFIIEKPGGIQKAKSEHQNWFISPGDNDALNYKIKISVKGEPVISAEKEKALKKNELNKGLDRRNDRDRINQNNRQVDDEYSSFPKINSMYFGNQSTNLDDIAKYKETVFYNEPINLEIICFNSELLEMIDKCIAEFFCVTNFGTRQSKGFGGFLVSNADADYEGILKESFQKVIKITGSHNDAGSLMTYAMIVYSVMKSGINSPRTRRYQAMYFKGFAVREFLDVNTGSEKAFIKRNNLAPNRDRGTHGSAATYEQYTFIRALLGLADNYSYKKIGGGKPQKVLVFNVDGIDYSTSSLQEILKELKDGKNEIDRFKSPVTIKIMPSLHAAYFCFDDSYRAILGKTFLFTDENKRGGKIIKTPNIFDHGKFVTDFRNYYESKKRTMFNNNAYPPFNLGAYIRTEVIK